MKPNSRLSVNQLVDYGIRLAHENQPEAARRFFEKALEREPRNTAALRAFCERVLGDPRLQATILPVGDGLLVAGWRGSDGRV